MCASKLCQRHKRLETGYIYVYSSLNFQLVQIWVMTPSLPLSVLFIPSITILIIYSGTHNNKPPVLTNCIYQNNNTVLYAQKNQEAKVPRRSCGGALGLFLPSPKKNMISSQKKNVKNTQKKMYNLPWASQNLTKVRIAGLMVGAYHVVTVITQRDQLTLLKFPCQLPNIINYPDSQYIYYH